MQDGHVLVRVRTRAGSDATEDAFVSVPRPLHEMLAAFVDGKFPNDPEQFALVCDGTTPIATRTERSAVAARVAIARGTPASITTWTTVVS